MFLTFPLNASHIKAHFDCGKDMLNRYLHQQAKQDMQRRLAACFVWADVNMIVSGYYTLSSASIPQAMLPAEVTKRLPNSYVDLPVTLLGRLALDNATKGKGMGAHLLMDAMKRAYLASVESVASMAIVVDPLDQDAVSFYAKYGFVLLPDSGKMFMPMRALDSIFGEWVMK
jgi:GNAT superfamily N-acetyltransferase